MAETKNYPLKKRPIQVVCDYVVEEPEQDEPVDLCTKRVKYDDDDKPMQCKPEITLKPINNNTIKSQHNESAFSFENSECEKYLQSKYIGEKSTHQLYDMLPGYRYDRYYHANPVPIKQEYPPSNPSRDYSVSPDYLLPKASVEFYAKQFVKEERYSQPSNRYAPYPLKHNNNLHEQYHMASSPNSLNSVGSPRRSVSPLSTSSINDDLYHHIPKPSAVSYEITEIYPQNCEEKPETVQRYQCTECGKSYSTYSGLTKHTQFHCPAIEGNQAKKTYDCEYCEKVYTSSGALKMHIRTHTLPCKCQICGKAFSRPWLLQGHIRTHTGEKPFSCQYCHRAFADRSNLRAHLQTHSDVKKYSCTTCVKTFSRMSLLTKHQEGGCAGLHRSLSPQYI